MLKGGGMAKTENIYIRIEPKIKEQAEEVLNELGIPMSNAVGMFLHQVVLNKGLPFQVKLPETEKPLCLSTMSEQDLDEIIQQGIQEYMDGKVITAEQLKQQMKKEFNI